MFILMVNECRNILSMLFEWLDATLFT